MKTILAAILVVLIATSCQLGKHHEISSIFDGQIVMPSSEFARGPEHFKKHPIYEPTEVFDGKTYRYLDPNGRHTTIELDPSSIVDIDKKSDKGFLLASYNTEQERERSIQILRSAIKSSFSDGLYSTWEEALLTPAGQAIKDRVVLGKPLEIALLHSSIVDELFAVPVIYEEKIVAMISMSKYFNKTGYKATRYDVFNSDLFKRNEDGIANIISKDTLINHISKTNSNKYKTLSINQDTNYIRVSIRTNPAISNFRYVWLVRSGGSSYLINENGELFRADMGYRVNNLHHHLENGELVKVRSLD